MISAWTDVKVIICSCLDTRNPLPLKARISLVCSSRPYVWGRRDLGTQMRLPLHFFCDMCCSWTQHGVIPLPSLLRSPRAAADVKPGVFTASGKTPMSRKGFASAGERTEGGQEMAWCWLSSYGPFLSFPFLSPAKLCAC